MRQPANGMQMAGLWEVCFIAEKGELFNFEVQFFFVVESEKDAIGHLWELLKLYVWRRNLAGSLVIFLWSTLCQGGNAFFPTYDLRWFFLGEIFEILYVPDGEKCVANMRACN